MKQNIMRKVICGALSASLVLSLAACKPVEQGKPGGASTVSAAAPAASSQPEKSDKPTLGIAETDYAFEYLQKETLTSEPGEKAKAGKSRSLLVFIPEDDYASVSKSRARSEKMGLSFTVELAPIFQYNEDDYTLAENLDYYLEMEYDPKYTIFDQVEVGKLTEDEANHTVKAVVTYCYYDEYDDTMIPYYSTYFLKQMDDGTKVLVSAEINGEGATGKLPGLLDEIDAFYGFRPEWDPDGADKLAEKAEAAGPKKKDDSSSTSSNSPASDPAVEVPAVKNGDGTFTASGMTFQLPEGWDIEDDDGDQSSYAPDGDAAFAGCAIMLMRQYSGASGTSLAVFKENPEALEAMLKSYVQASMDDGENTDMNFKMCETSPFGTAIRLDFTQEEGKVNAYFIFGDDEYLYIMMAADTEDDMPAKNALDTMFSSAKLN